jgi:protein-S-isoprenylcysteine O-methyltransferase Ste14
MRKLTLFRACSLAALAIAAAFSSSPAPAQQSTLISDGMKPGQRIEIRDLKRDEGGTVTLRFQFINDCEKDRKPVMSREVVMVLRLIVQTLVWYGAMGLALFLAAGTADWIGAWVFLAQMIGFSLVGGLWFARHDPDLVRERLAPPIQKDQPAADKILVTVIILAVFGAFVLMALDAVRFGWSSVPPWVQAIGELILLLSVWIGFQTLRENSFAAPVVKIQEARGQTVITTGPYRHVRHPMYAGALLFIAGASLLLGSWWGLAAVLVLAVLLGIRIQIEETALRAGLEGYDEYAERVPCRLIPLVW